MNGGDWRHFSFLLRQNKCGRPVEASRQPNFIFPSDSLFTT